MEGPVDLEALVAGRGQPPAPDNLATPVTLVQPMPQPIVPQIMIIPSQERLNKTSQRVSVQNTDREQTHVIIDRHMNGHELRPGQVKEIEMVVDELEALRELGRPNRGVFMSGHRTGQVLPRHPVRFLDIPEAKPPLVTEPVRRGNTR
jgi:hypothetical protein